ncbi:MAG: hypothetical protein HC843_05790 [Sphingomonadales bacterium]|nr:hypothetical protein [Sphingomonadales bacterium]
MADISINKQPSNIKSLKADGMEKILAVLSTVLLLAALTALGRGLDEWHLLPWQVWTHLGTILTALAITPVMMLRKRGDDLHRLLGWIWSAAMFATALISFDIRLIAKGEFSFIHLLSLLTLVGVPVLIGTARRHKIAQHRRQARGFIIGALLVAGFFTFPFDRLLGSWLFG